MKIYDFFARLLPNDPDYEPFGWSVMRGLNILPFAIVAALGLMCNCERLAYRIALTDRALTESLGQYFSSTLQTLFVFTPMLVLVALAGNLVRGGGARIAALTAATLLGALVQPLMWPVSFCLVGRVEWSQPLCVPPPIGWFMFGPFVRGLLWGGAITLVMVFERRQREATRGLHETRRLRLEAEKREIEARLRSLQAQIEPHFLFNTLAHVRRFGEVDARRARSMLASLVEVLRASLPQMRATGSTLGRETALARAYLDLQQIRMGSRLAVEIDVPPALHAAPLPPMMLLTLAENAIKHGLGPKQEGGRLRIAARRCGDALEVAVSDDGVGLGLGCGSGRGLANTRARLAALYGAEAELQIANGREGGVRAALVLPWRGAQAAPTPDAPGRSPAFIPEYAAPRLAR